MNDKYSKRKRILEITFHSPTCHCGGIEDATLNLIREFAKSGNVVTSAFYSGVWDTEELDSELVKPLKFSKGDQKKNPSMLSKTLFNLRIALYVWKNRKKYDVVHFNGDNGGLASLFSVGKGIHSVPGLSLSKGRTLYGRKNFFRRAFIGAIYLPAILFEFLGLRYSTKVVCDNQFTLSSVKSILKNSEKKASLIPNSVDDRYFYPILNKNERDAIRERLGLKSELFYAIWVGTNPFNYGLDIATESILKSGDKWHFIVVGPKQPFKDEKVHYVGYLDHSLLGDYYRASNVFLFPKRYEGVELAVLSSMLSGTVPILDSKFSPRYFTNQEAFFVGSQSEIVILLNSISESPDIVENKVKDVLKRAQKQIPSICSGEYLSLFKQLWN